LTQASEAKTPEGQFHRLLVLEQFIAVVPGVSPKRGGKVYNPFTEALPALGTLRPDLHRSLAVHSLPAVVPAVVVPLEKVAELFVQLFEGDNFCPIVLLDAFRVAAVKLYLVRPVAKARTEVGVEPLVEPLVKRPPETFYRLGLPAPSVV
jgi:hypothetical protein